MSLITNISQVRAASTINISNSLANWQPYIDEAEAIWIRPVIGDTLFETLEEAANASGSGESAYDEILEKIRRTLALYALYLGIDEMAVSLSSSGIQVIQSENHKPASQYQIQNLKESFLARAHRNMDLLLKYIEENIDDYPNYPGFDDELFIHNAEEFQQYVDIRSSRRVYIALKPIMRNIEKRFIKPALSPEYYDEIKAAVKASQIPIIIDEGGGDEGQPQDPLPPEVVPLTNDDQDIVDMIKPAVAHLTIARALEEISIDMLDWGAFDTAVNTFDKIQGKQAANADRIGAMIEVNKRDGDADMRELQEYLDTNATEEKYATYYASDRYAGADKATTRLEFENTEDNSIFIP